MQCANTHGAHNFCCCQADPGLNYAEWFSVYLSGCLLRWLASQLQASLVCLASACSAALCLQLHSRSCSSLDCLASGHSAALCSLLPMHYLSSLARLHHKHTKCLFKHPSSLSAFYDHQESHKWSKAEDSYSESTIFHFFLSFFLVKTTMFNNDILQTV